LASDRKKILIIDDDPSHLEIYGLLMQRAGHDAIPLLVRFSGVDAYPEIEVSLVLLDYRLNSFKTAPELGQECLNRYPGVPIVVLSDLWTLPADMIPVTDKFVRKGNPEKLLKAIAEVLSDSVQAKDQ
jgi:DNA-binding NtrC family response regulator